MKKLIVFLTLVLFSFSGFTQSHKPWYESPNSKNYFFDAVGVSHSFGSIGGGVSVIKEHFLVDLSYGGYNLTEGDYIDMVKISADYIFYKEDHISILSGVGYNHLVTDSEFYDHRPFSLEFGTKAQFKKIQVSLLFDFICTEGRLTLFYNL